MANNFPYKFDPENPLPKNGEELLRSIFGAYTQYAEQPALYWHFVNGWIDELLGYCDMRKYNFYTELFKALEVRRQFLLACLNREDRVGFRKHLNYWWDWRGRDNRKLANVSKFIPGDHYHTLDTKFGTLAEAKEHITENGYIFGRFIEKHVYVRDGD